MQSKKYECPICKCFTDLPQDYYSIVPVSISPILLTNQPQPQPNLHPKHPTLLNIKYEHRPTRKLRLLVLCESELAPLFYDGLQCLVEILPQYRDHSLEICLVMYDTRIRVIELE